MSLDKMIKEQKLKVSEIEQVIAGLQQQIDDLRSDHDTEQGILVGLQRAQESTVTTAQQPEKEERRMRLGAKKRLIYSLVLNGFETVGSLTKALSETNVDGRYARDVVRKAISIGDILGEIDDRFILSEDGKEILSKAPIPKGWGGYELMALRSPHPRGDHTGSTARILLNASERLKALQRQAITPHKDLRPAPNITEEQMDRAAWAERQARDL